VALEAASSNLVSHPNLSCRKAGAVCPGLRA